MPVLQQIKIGRLMLAISITVVIANIAPRQHLTAEGFSHLEENLEIHSIDGVGLPLGQAVLTQLAYKHEFRQGR